MSDLEKMKENILDRYATKRVLISELEHRKLPDSEKEKCSFFVGDYYYDKKLSIPQEELDTFFTLKTFEAQMETKEEIALMKESHYQLLRTNQSMEETIKEMKMAVVAIKNIVIFVFIFGIIASIFVAMAQMQRF